MANSRQRKIIHVDMDCFYAAVETRENPRLKGRPVAVGGKPNSRGVVAACNYEARAFGVHSALAMSIAVRRCPNLIYLPVRMDLYRQVSQQIHAIFSDYTDKIEPLSLDEAYLDVSESNHLHGSATLIAQEIRQRIYQEHQLTASAGIAPNKFLAKITSDWNKPNGQKTIAPSQVDAFIKTVPVKRIYGVGKVTAAKMHKLGLESCLDLQTWSSEALQQQFGSFGIRLHALCRGQDERPVSNERQRKSLSIEDTFPVDLSDATACLTALPALYEAFQSRLQRAHKNNQAHALTIKTLFLKMRFSDFSTTTIQMPGAEPNLTDFEQLCGRAWERGKLPVRLLGLGVRFASSESSQQLLLAKES